MKIEDGELVASADVWLVMINTNLSLITSTFMLQKNKFGEKKSVLFTRKLH